MKKVILLFCFFVFISCSKGLDESQLFELEYTINFGEFASTVLFLEIEIDYTNDKIKLHSAELKNWNLYTDEYSGLAIGGENGIIEIDIYDKNINFHILAYLISRGLDEERIYSEYNIIGDIPIFELIQL